jgi:O-antigen ligase/Tfp pilus assembly protein PilF
MNPGEKYLTYGVKAGIFIIPFIPLIVTQSLFFPFITGKNFVFRIVVEMLVLLWLALVLKYRKYAPRRSPLMWSVVAFSFVLVLATAFSIDPARSFWSNAERMEGLFGMLHVFAFFVVSTSVLTKKDWLAFFGTSIAVSVLVSFHGISQLLGRAQIHQGGVRLDANFGNATYLAVYLLFHIFLSFYLITELRKRWLRWALGGVALLNAVILYYTATRGSILGLIAGFVIFAAFLTFLARGRIRSAGMVGLAICIIVPALFYMVRGSAVVTQSPVLSRFASISPTEQTTQSRFLIWSIALEGWKERPVLGWGQENFMYVFSKEYRPELWRQEPWFDRAHNVFLDWMVAAGILGLAAYLSLFAAAILSLWRTYRKGIFSPVQAALFAGLMVAYGVHNLFVFDNLVSYILFFAVLGYLHAAGMPARERAAHAPGVLLGWREALIMLAAFGSVFLLWKGNVRPALAARDVIDGLEGLAQETPSAETIRATEQKFRQGLSRETFLTTETREAWATQAARIAQDVRLPVEMRRDFFLGAVEQEERQVKEHPNDMRARLFLLELYDRAGEFEKGEALAEETISIAPRRQFYRFLYGDLLIEKGEVERGLSELRYAYDLAPDYPEAVRNYAFGLIVVGRGEEGEEVLLRHFGSRWPPDPQLAALYEGRGDYRRALSVREAIVEADPQNAQLHYNLAWAYLRVYEDARAIAHLEQVIVLSPGAESQVQAIIESVKDGTVDRFPRIP